MWFPEDDCHDDDRYASNSDIDSELEAQVYSQLHYGDGNNVNYDYHEPQQQTISTPVNNKLPEPNKSVENEVNDTSKKKRKSIASTSVRKMRNKASGENNDIFKMMLLNLQSAEMKTDKRKRKSSSPATVNDERRSGLWSTIGKEQSNKRKSLESKYDYSLSKQNGYISVNSSSEVIVISSDTDHEKSHSKRSTKLGVNNVASLSTETPKMSKQTSFNSPLLIESSSSDEYETVTQERIKTDLHLHLNNSFDVLSSRKVNDRKRKRDISKTFTPSRTKQRKRESIRSQTGLTPIERMRKFYDSEEDESEEFDEMRSRLPLNEDLWKISIHDLHWHASSAKRYFGTGPNRVLLTRCTRCNSHTHRVEKCPQVKPQVCCLCSKSGHYARNCPSVICARCEEPGHSRERCRTDLRTLMKPCGLCGRPGHGKQTCPDHWRRYYLTTTPEIIIRGSGEVNEKLYCYNCGEKGHLGHMCRRRRMTSDMFPNIPFIMSYSDETIESKTKAGFSKRRKRRKDKSRKTLSPKKVKRKNEKHRRTL